MLLVLIHRQAAYKVSLHRRLLRSLARSHRVAVHLLSETVWLSLVPVPSSSSSPSSLSSPPSCIPLLPSPPTSPSPHAEPSVVLISPTPRPCPLLPSCVQQAALTWIYAVTQLPISYKLLSATAKRQELPFPPAPRQFNDQHTAGP